MTSPVPASMSDEAYMLCRTDASVVTRQLTTFKLPTRQKSVVLPRGQTMTLGSVTGCGYVTQIWVTFDGWFWKNWDPSAPVSQTILKTLITLCLLLGPLGLCITPLSPASPCPDTNFNIYYE